ncbi:unnamed protein product, partial [Choristocarpus tenellus]
EGVVRVFEKLVEVTTGVRKEDMVQPVFAGVNELSYVELYHEAIPELAMFRAVSKLMRVSFVDDFSFKDMLKPNRQR